MKGIIPFLLSLIVLVLLVFPRVVLAEFIFSSSNTTISPDQELELPINLSLQGQSLKAYYLAGGFKKEGGSTYFGLTQNDTTWVPYSSSNYTLLKKITTNSDGVWSGLLKTKLDLSSSQYIGSGNYTLQIRRFTETGSATNSDNTITIQVQQPSPPLSPSPSPENSPSPSPSTSTEPLVSPNPTPSTSPSPSPSVIPSFFISSPPTIIQSTEEFTITVNLNKLTPNSKYYLKGAFVAEDSTNYFGKTNVGESWIKNNASSASQFPLTTDSQGSWSGDLKIQGDPEDSGYIGTGAYIFKVARYNSSGSGLTWSNEYEITINGSIGGPQPQSSPSLSPSPSIKPSNSPSPISINLTRDLGKIATNSASSSAQILGISTPSAKIATTINPPLKKTVNFWLIGSAVLLLAASLTSVVIKLKKR